ncbi:hypothetical protein Tco_0344444 [Tanacetum coccineum]
MYYEVTPPVTILLPHILGVLQIGIRASPLYYYLHIRKDSDGPPLGIDLVPVYGYESNASEAALQSLEHAPHSLEYALPANDDLEPAEAQALPTPVSPREPSEEEGEELPAPVATTPAIADPASPYEETEPFEEDETSLPLSIDAHIEAWLAAPTPSSPPPSPLSPLSSPLPKIPSPPLPSSPIHRDSILEADLPPRKRARLSSSSPRFEIGESSVDASARQPRQDSHKIYVHLQDAQDDKAVFRALLASSVREARYLHTSVIIAEQEATYAHDAWRFAMDRIIELHHQRHNNNDIVTRVIGRVREIEHARELERWDGPPDTSSSYVISCVIFLMYLKKMPPKKNSMSAAIIDQQIAQHVADALVEYVANRNNGNGNENGNDNGNGSHDSGSGGGRTSNIARVCTYKEFLNCQPLNFKGTEGAIGLAYWTVGHDAAYGMPWKTLMKMMTEAYCLRSEIKKLETELWNLTLKGGLPDSINGSVMQADNKRRKDNSRRNNHAQQPPYKRQNMDRAYTAGPGEKREYAGTLPLCNKCNFYQNGPCAAKCTNYKRVGHLARYCRSPAATNIKRGPGVNQNRGNPTGNDETHGRAYVLGGGHVRCYSFDVIIGMDWLSKYHATIVYDEKIFRIPYGNEVLIVRGDRSDTRSDSRLNIISCTKTQKYLFKGCHVFLAHITKKKAEDKSEEKRLEDAPIVCDFPEVFPEDLPGVPPT